MRPLVNTGRQSELDVAKVLAIPYMVIIHVYEEMSEVNYHVMPDNLFRIILEFLGGPLAAPVFMFAMGVGMVYTHHRTPRAFAMRGLRLLAAAYLLNLVRMTIPYGIAVLSGDSWGSWTIVDTIGLVDILQFAGMAFLLVALLEKWRVGRYGIVAVALLLQGLGTLLLHSFDQLPLIAQYAVGLVFFTNPNIAFPLSLWFVYPACGIFFGEFLQTVTDKRKLYNRIGLLSAAGLVAGTVSLKYMGYHPLRIFALADESYYIQHFAGTVWTLFVIGIQLFLCYRISLHLQGRMQQKTEFISRHLNTIYLIQWVLIPYTLLVMEMADLPLVPAWAIVPVGLLMTVVSILCARYVRIKV